MESKGSSLTARADSCNHHRAGHHFDNSEGWAMPNAYRGRGESGMESHLPWLCNYRGCATTVAYAANPRARIANRRVHQQRPRAPVTPVAYAENPRARIANPRVHQQRPRAPYRPEATYIHTELIESSQGGRLNRAIGRGRIGDGREGGKARMGMGGGRTRSGVGEWR